MSRFCFCNCPAGFSAEPERHAPDCPGRSGAGKARTPVPATLTASQPADSGVDFGIDGRSVRVSQEAYSIFLAREASGREKIAALQQRLTEADERADSFDRLYTSSLDERDQLQQRADVLERVEVRYRWLQKATPYQFKKIQDASVTDGGDVLYFHADRFDAAVDAALKPAEPAKGEHICTGCGSKGWTANCKECVPY